MEEDADEDKYGFTLDGINACYLIGSLLTVSLGMVQFGYMIGSWNTASAAYGKRENWDEDDMTVKVMTV